MYRKWSRDEEILALVLYCQIPFGKIHAHNPEIIKLASSLSRTPASVSMKMCNFARFDSTLTARGITELQNGSKLDELIWDEFRTNWEGLVIESKLAAERLNIKLGDDEPEVSDLPIGYTQEQFINVRRNQSFFRKAVLSSYEHTCCITGLAIPKLLIASHIKPWWASDPAAERTNPQNGLCLNALHDRAFDQGLITITPDYRIELSHLIRDEYDSEIVAQWFYQYEGTKIRLPNRFAPAKEYLEYHNEHIFKS